jgi:hypothetical protein
MSQFVWNGACWKPDPDKKPADYESLLDKYASKDEPKAETAEKPAEKPAVKSDKPGERCPDHPNYKGIRLGATAKQCPHCLAIYQKVKASGYKETRNLLVGNKNLKKMYSVQIVHTVPRKLKDDKGNWHDIHCLTCQATRASFNKAGNILTIQQRQGGKTIKTTFRLAHSDFVSIQRD